jgi:hypothetical protein
MSSYKGVELLLYVIHYSKTLTGKKLEKDNTRGIREPGTTKVL